MTRAATFASGMPVALETKGTVREARGIDLQDVDDPALDGELDVHQTNDVQGLGKLAGLRTQLILDFLGQPVGRQRAAGIARMHARLFDVFHDAADQHVLAVADGIDVHFDGEIQESIEQHRTVVRHLHGVGHVLAQVILVEHHLHGAAAEHVARAHHQRKPDFARHDDGLLLGACRWHWRAV